MRPRIPEVEPPEVASASALLGFYVGPEEYVVDLRRVIEILVPPPVTSLPRAPAFIEGVVHLRGGVVPVLNARQRLEAGPPSPRLKSKLVVHWLGTRRVAMRVDGLTEVVRALPEDLKPAPRLLPAGVESYVLGVCSAGGSLRLLLDVKALWRRPPSRA